MYNIYTGFTKSICDSPLWWAIFIMKTPCINVCKLDPSDEYCLGCNRTFDEIVDWMELTDEQRDEIIERTKLIK